jgi:hypothetical protein
VIPVGITWKEGKRNLSGHLHKVKEAYGLMHFLPPSSLQK